MFAWQLRGARDYNNGDPWVNASKRPRYQFFKDNLIDMGNDWLL